MNKVRIISFGLLLAASATQAQTCPQFPADCPDMRTATPGSPEDSADRLTDRFLLPLDVAMEQRLRRWVTSLVNNITHKEGWDVVEIEEDLGLGYGDGENVTPYDHRPPHWLHFTWEFVINNDSLMAWRNWLEDFGRRRLNQSDQYTTRASAKQNDVQACMDSAVYWGNQMGKYMTDHIGQYQKDLTSGNKAGVSAYEKGLAVYQKRQEYFINKGKALQKDPQGEKDNADADQESRTQRIRFRDASVVIMEFDFNSRIVETGGNRISSPAGALAGVPAGSPAGVKWYAISEPDLLDRINVFMHSRNMALWVMGSWDAQPNRDGSYPATWAADRNNTHTTTIKKIMTDKVQNIYVRLSGNAAAMRRILANLPAGEFERLITRP